MKPASVTSASGYCRPVDRRRGTPAHEVSGRNQLVNPVARELEQARRLRAVRRVAGPGRSLGEGELWSSGTIDFDPEEIPDEPVFRISANPRVERRPVPRLSTSPAQPERESTAQPQREVQKSPAVQQPRKSLRDTFERLAPEELRNHPIPEAEDGSVVPVMETADWHIPLSRETSAILARKRRIRQCLDFYYQRPLNTAEDSSWSMMHHMLAWGRDSKIYIGPPGGRVESTVGWLCANGVCDNERLLFVRDGQIRAKMGPGLQGHTAQFLAMLAQCRVHIDQPIRVGSKHFTVRDLIEQEQRACVPRSELTFTLIGCTHFLHTETKWKNSRGQEWSIPRLMYEEMRQPINGVTCGGTHRLMGLSYAVRRREADGYPINGIWERARRFTASYHSLAFNMQNRDASFSSDFFRSRGSWGDLGRKLKTTGHTLEWLVFSLPHEELQSPPLTRAVDYLTNMLIQNRYYDWDNGALGHSIRALNLYDERVFRGRPAERRLQTASANAPMVVTPTKTMTPSQPRPGLGPRKPASRLRARRR